MKNRRGGGFLLQVGGRSTYSTTENFFEKITAAGQEHVANTTEEED
jgi:hypothetical protein